MANKYKFNVRNETNDDWVNVLQDSNIVIDTDGVAAGQFASNLLDEVLVELKGLAGGAVPGYAGTPIHILNTDDVIDSSDDTGSFSTLGGMAVSQSLFVGGELNAETTANFVGIASFSSSINIGTNITSVQNITGDGTGSISGFVDGIFTGNIYAVDTFFSGTVSTDILSISTSIDFGIGSTIDGDIVPTVDSVQYLGSIVNKWNTIYTDTINATTINSETFIGSFNGNVSGNVTGDVTGNLNGNLIGSPTVRVTSNQGSVSPITGALVIEGGLGVNENIYVGGNISVTGSSLLDGVVAIPDLTNSTNRTTGALIVDGGVGIGKDLYIGGNLYINNTTSFTSGTGSPEGIVTAEVGSLYTDITGGVSTTLYVKESGVGNTGWIAK